MSHGVTDECIACGACVPECQEQAIAEDGGRFEIDPGKCTDCGTCAEVCPVGACLPGRQARPHRFPGAASEEPSD